MAQRTAILAGVGLLGPTAALLAGCAAPAVEVETPPAPVGTPATTPSAEAPPTTAPPAAGGAFTDGTYTAEGGYFAPSGPESVVVTITVQGDTVAVVEVVGSATDPSARQFQGQFISGIAAEVVGRPLEGLSVSRVSGSSLTSGGFNEAVEAIRSQARAG